MKNILLIIAMLFSGLLFAQKDAAPVNKNINDKRVPAYPDTNSIYMPPDTNAIYREEQGYPDKEGNKQSGDTVMIKKPVENKVAPKDKTKVVPKEIKKPDRDTTGKGEKQNF